MNHLPTDESDLQALREAHERRQQAKLMAHNTAEAFTRCASGLRRQPELFIEAMDNQHRTMQQSATGLMLQWFAHLAALADKPGWYDLRNEASVKTAKIVMDALAAADKAYRDDQGVWHIGLPMI